MLVGGTNSDAVDDERGEGLCVSLEFWSWRFRGGMTESGLVQQNILVPPCRHMQYSWCSFCSFNSLPDHVDVNFQVINGRGIHMLSVHFDLIVAYCQRRDGMPSNYQSLLFSYYAKAGVKWPSMIGQQSLCMHNPPHSKVLA